MTEAADQRLGTTLAGYRVDSLIGRGGMSVVYLAEDIHLGRKVALKLLAPELAQDEKFRERFVRESRLAASLEHPNIVTVFEARETDGLLYIAMRYVAGTDLKSLISQEGPFDPERTISILSQAASALDAAHAEGLIHRDVKPGNVLITPRGESLPTDRVYLSDFGLTKRATSDSGITATGQFVGTLDYAAPEQFEGRPVDGRADVYSLGCVLYECLVGEVPFPKENQAALVYAHLHAPPPTVTAKLPDLSPAIDQVVARAMAKKAEDRYPTAGGLAGAAAEALGVQPVTPTTPTRLAPLPPGRRRRMAALAIGAAALAVVGIVVGLVLANRGGTKAGVTAPPAAALVDYLARVDPAARTLIAKVPLGKHPIDVAVGEGSVWVLDEDGSVRRIDPVTNNATVIRGVAEDPRAIVAGEGGVWVADGTKSVVRRIDPASNRVVASLRVGAVVYDVAVGENGAWVAAGSGIVRIEPSSGDVSELHGSVGEVGGPPRARYKTGVGEGFVWQIYTLLPQAGRFQVGTGRFDLVDVGVVPRAIAVSGPDVWLGACGAPGTVVRLDAQAGEVIATLAAGGSVCSDLAAPVPISIAAGHEGVWVTDGVNGTVSRISGATNQVDVPIKVGDTPTAVAVGLGSVWVTVDGK